MALLAEAKELPLRTHLTLEQAANKTGTNYDALRKWLVRGPEITVYRIGDVLLVRKIDLGKYNHR